jgi:L-iditol 2-dehydrogenase
MEACLFQKRDSALQCSLMSAYNGKKFICHSANSFDTSDSVWNYRKNQDTSLIRVGDVGMCNSDFSRLFLGTGHQYPITPGHEITGRIEETGRIEDFPEKASVCIFPLIPCRRCISCSNNDYNLCLNYSYLGSRQDGGLSTYIEVPNWNIKSLPSNLNQLLVPMIEPLSVLFHAFDALEDTSSGLLITGSGFLSYLSLCISKYLGFKNIRIMSTSKSNTSLFEEYFYKDKIREEIEIRSCIDLSGNFSILNSATKLLHPKSVIVTLANSRKDTYVDSETRERILRKELRYVGSWNSSYSMTKNSWDEAIKFIMTNPEFKFPTRVVSLRELPYYLKSLDSIFPKERIHVSCSD